MTTLRPLVRLALLAAMIGAPWPAQALTQVASVAGVRGTVEVQRGGRGEWQPLFAGNPVFIGEPLRSSADSSAALVFTDDCVVVLGPDTAMTVDLYGSRGKGPKRALLKLEGGAIQAIVSGYGSDASRFEVETSSAIVRVQSTQFVVRYDPRSRATDVAGLDGVVAVQGRTGLIGPGVAVGANEVSRVEVGKFPSPVRIATAEERAELTAGLAVPGGGNDGLDTDNPVLAGLEVAESERPQLAAAAAQGGPYLKPATPDEPLIWRLSPDMRANTQSLPVYEAYPPNVVPPQQ